MREELTLPATPENLEQVLEFAGDHLTGVECSMKTLMQFQIAVEEIYVNIASYAYGTDTGMVTICFEAGGDPPCVSFTFVDQGKPYDPLEEKEPDITLSAKEREIGGLGIYLVKKFADKVTYEYRDKKNVLTIRKTI